MPGVLILDELQSATEGGGIKLAAPLQTQDGADLLSPTGQVSVNFDNVANNVISGDKIHGGIISGFSSTGIQDNANSVALTIDSGGVNATGYAINNHSIWQVVNIQRYHMGSGNSTTISSDDSDYTNVGNSISYTPKKAGNILVIEHGVLTWYGSTSNGSGDIFIRFLIDGSEVWVNDRARGNFDADEQRSHHYLRSQFLYTTTGTSAITIQFQGSASGDVPGGFNFYHTECDANQYIITEYEQ